MDIADIKKSLNKCEEGDDDSKLASMRPPPSNSLILEGSPSSFLRFFSSPSEDGWSYSANTTR